MKKWLRWLWQRLSDFGNVDLIAGLLGGWRLLFSAASAFFAGGAALADGLSLWKAILVGLGVLVLGLAALSLVLSVWSRLRRQLAAPAALRDQSGAPVTTPVPRVAAAPFGSGISLYVGDIRIGTGHLKADLYVDISIRGTNGTGHSVRFSGIRGSVKINPPGAVDATVALPAPSLPERFASQEIEDQREFVVALEQRVPAAVASQFLGLSDQAPVTLDFRGLDIVVASVSEPGKQARLAVWEGVRLAGNPVSPKAGRVVYANLNVELAPAVAIATASVTESSPPSVRLQSHDDRLTLLNDSLYDLQLWGTCYWDKATLLDVPLPIPRGQHHHFFNHDFIVDPTVDFQPHARISRTFDVFLMTPAGRRYVAMFAITIARTGNRTRITPSQFAMIECDWRTTPRGNS